MREVSQQFLDTVSLPHRVVTTVTCTPPGGNPVSLEIDTCSITATSGTGKRKSAEVVFAPVENFDLYELVATPGSLFNIAHGFRYSAASSELIPLLDGEAASGASPLEDGSVSMSLVDLYTVVERSRFLNPYAPPAGLRAQTIADTMADALGPLPESVTTDGGSALGTSVWDRDRTQTITDLATDGGLEAYVDSNGERGLIVVRAAPTIDPKNAVWTIRSGDGGTMISGSRERPLDRLYNTVVVVPQDDTQTWPRQISPITNPNHPRYPGKIGVVPYFWSSPSITTATAAKRAGDAILTQIQGTSETIRLTAVANAALEPGDVVTIVKSGPVGQRAGATNMIDSWVLDCVTGSMELDTKSSVFDQEETV